VRIIANSMVVDRADKVYQQKIDKWKQILGSGATSRVVAIENFDGKFIAFDGSQSKSLNTSKVTQTKTRCFGFLDREPSLRRCVVNSMHLYTAETTVRLERNGLPHYRKSES